MTCSPRRAFVGLAAIVLAIVGCSDPTTAPTPTHPPRAPSFAILGAEDVASYSPYLADLNRRMFASGGRVAVVAAELLLAPNAPAKTPTIILATDRTLRLPLGWVSADLRRLATDATLSYAVYPEWKNAAIGGDGEASFDASFATWNAATCSNLVVRKKSLDPGEAPNAGPGQVPSFLFTGLFPPADINDVGFQPPAAFDQLLGAGASQFVIGVTVPFVFIEPGPNGDPIPTDIDRDGRADLAFTETWYNDGFPYATNGTPGPIDIETVALHEHGHSLGLGHFGRISFDPKTGKLHVSPRAVMNAFILGVLRTPLGTDVAALCGDYGSWK